MLKKWMPFFLFALFLGACKGPGLETVENVDSYGYVEQYTRKRSDFAKEGQYLRFSPQGKKVEEAYFHNDTLEGLRILFYETGDTQSVETYRMGSFEGDYRSFYPNGNINLVGEYTGNSMSGKWRRYYDSGELMEIVTFENNEENGPFVEYFKNGNLKAEGHYLNGDNEHGELKLYNEQGKLIRIMDCQNGKCITTWQEEEETQ